MSVTFFNRNTPAACYQKIKDLAQNGVDIVCVAFSPHSSNSWVVVNGNGEIASAGIPNALDKKMKDLSKGGSKLVWVAFSPQDGNIWVVINEKGESASAKPRR